MGISYNIDKKNSLDVTKREAAAKVTRDTTVSSDITFLGVQWQVLNDAEDIRNALKDAEILGVDDSFVQPWRLADNSWRDTTFGEAKLLLAEHIARKQKVWAQFGVWDASDKSTDFEYVEE